MKITRTITALASVAIIGLSACGSDGPSRFASETTVFQVPVTDAEPSCLVECGTVPTTPQLKCGAGTHKYNDTCVVDAPEVTIPTYDDSHSTAAFELMYGVWTSLDYSTQIQGCTLDPVDLAAILLKNLPQVTPTEAYAFASTICD